MKSLLFFVFIISLPLSSYAETTKLRAECRKGSDKGCTAHFKKCYSAPAGKYIKASTLSSGTVTNYWKKKASCGPAEADSYISVYVEQIDDVAYLPVSFCATLHVESGSGLDNIGTVAFVDCEYSFTLKDLN